MHGRFGKPCPDCGTSAQRIVYAENECNYCPRCQTAGRLLADRAVSRLLVVLILAYIVAGWTRRAVLAALIRAKLEETISKFASNAARYAVLILGLMSCAPIMGINITSFAAVLGAGGLAVGLASQGRCRTGRRG